MNLPEIILFNDYGGNWENYFEALYEIFKNDFVKSKPVYRGTKLALKKHPLLKGKEATFWHLITKNEERNKQEEDRTPELRRCERINWIKPIIDNSTDVQIKMWEESKRRNENRIHLCFGDWEYLVVIAERKGYLLPWTAFPVTDKHSKKKLKKRYNSYIAKTAQ